MNKRIKSQPIAVQLELLNEEAVWNIFEEYGGIMTREQLKAVYRILSPDLTFEEWRLLYDKGISICVAPRSNKTGREICS